MQRWRWWWYTLSPVEKAAVLGWALFALWVISDGATGVTR